MVEIENPPLQGYCEPVCVSVFWSIIYIAPLFIFYIGDSAAIKYFFLI